MKYKSLAISSALALGLSAGFMHSATADVHAVAANDITNLSIVFTQPTPPDSAVFRLDTNANLLSIPGTDGYLVPVNGGVAPFDITQAFQGSGAAPAENTFTAVGDTGSNYARSDSSLPSTQLNPGPDPTPSGNTTRSLAIAESYLNSNDNGFGDAGNSSVTTIDFQLTVPQTINFSFDSDPYLLARVDPDSAFASDASAEISLVFVITNDNGDVVFEWAPDGSGPGAITGGTETLDPFALNLLVTRDQDNPGNSLVDEANSGFAAVTNTLAADVYTLELRQRTTVNTQLTRAVVPEPEMLGLLGMSMLGLGFARFLRRRKTA